MRPSGNGANTGRRKMPHAQKQAAGLPVGNAPREFSKAEKQAFNELKDQWWWADRTHRRFLIATAKVTVKLDRANDFFRKRKAEFIAAGKEPALAYLTDDGERHPRMTELLEAENELADAFPVAEKHKAEVEAESRPVNDDDPSGALRYFR